MKTDLKVLCVVGCVLVPGSGLVPARVASAQTVTINPIAVTGQAAPGTPGGTTFSGFTALSVAPGGNVAFVASLAGGGTVASNNAAVYVASVSGSPALRVRKGAALEGAGVTIANLNPVFPLSVSNAGDVFVDALLTGTGISAANNRTFYRFTPALIGTKIARLGDTAAGAPAGSVFSILGNLSTNSTGSAAFAASVAGGASTMSTDRGLWKFTGSTLARVLGEDAQAPGVGAGVLYDDFASVVPLPSGDIACFAFLRGAGVSAANDTMYVVQGSSTRKVAREGEAAPGLGAGVVFADLGAGPFVVGSGQIAYGSQLSGTGVTPLNDEAVWVEGSSLFREDAIAPGTGGTRVLTGLISPKVVSNAVGGRVLSAFLRDPVNPLATSTAGLWVDSGSGWTVVAREGFAAPGNDPGVTFSRFDRVAIDDTGTVAFQAQLSGTGVNSGNALAIYTYSQAAGPVRVARNGSPLTIGPGDTRTVLALAIPGRSGDGQGNPTNLAAGSVVFSALFGDLSSAILGAALGGGCDSIDFNNDGVSPDSLDIDDFLSVFAGGPCSNDPNCGDIDFNNDGVSPDSTDIDVLLSIFGGGTCP